MLIRTDNNERITSMLFRLNSMDLNFRCITHSPTSVYESYPEDDLIKPNELKICFKDSREVDDLINMLEEFRDGCSKKMGVWKEY